MRAVRDSLSEPPVFSGFSALAERYDGFILDLWGVLHDGVSAYPGAVDCLRRMKEHGKRVVILSNAPRRARAVAERTSELGIGRSLYTGLLSSGEATWTHLKARSDPWHRALGRRCFHLGPDRDKGLLDGLDFDFVETIGAADFVLTTGASGPEDTVETYAAMLQEAAARRLPMVCANPDLAVVRAGRREICAGALAAYYEEIGGEVRYHGKPHTEIYESCFELLAVRDRGRIAAVGDSLRTDIAGAKRVGIDAIFVAGGLHGDELGMVENALPDRGRLVALLGTIEQKPTAVVAAFQW